MRDIPNSIALFVTACCMAFSPVAMAGQHQAALDAIAGYAFGQTREPLTVVEDLVRATAGNPGARAVLAEELANMLDADTSLDCKQFVCRQLAVIGGPDQVPVLASKLYDEKTADFARYALTSIPGDAADNALIDALDEAPLQVRAGIATSLGTRRSERAVRALGACARGENAVLADAAIAALGRIGTKKSMRALAAAGRNAGPDRKQILADARLACADLLMTEGEADEARQTYEQLLEDGPSDHVRAAALVGLLRSDGPAAVKRIEQVIGTEENPVLREVAIQWLHNTAAEYEALAGRAAR